MRREISTNERKATEKRRIKLNFSQVLIINRLKMGTYSESSIFSRIEKRMTNSIQDKMPVNKTKTG
ncbi:hypothetical protein AL479_12805 [Citrobacter amalonaticus]|nr:hypothetical protein AL479_12805 [Citrobacter amalonaticus]